MAVLLHSIRKATEQMLHLYADKQLATVITQYISVYVESLAV